MSTRESPMERGRRKGLAAEHRFLQEIRDARLALGMSQKVAAARAGIARTGWTRVERGGRGVPEWVVAGQMAAAVGLDLVVSLYPSDQEPRDSGQLRMLADAKRWFGAQWRWRHEVAVADGDERAWDAVLTSRVDDSRVHLESETVLHDIQAMLRRLNAKRTTGEVDSLLLVARDSRRNRRVAKDAVDVLTAEFPVPARVALEHLRRGAPPPGSALLFVRPVGPEVDRDAGGPDAGPVERPR